MAKVSHTVSNSTTIHRWMFTIALGSLFNSIVMAASEDNNIGSVILIDIIMYLFIFCCLGCTFSVPALIALILLSGQLNKRNFTFREYVMRHNGFHLLIAICSFTLAAAVQLFSHGLQVFIVGSCYTFAGLLVWNGGFLVHLRKQRIKA